MLNKLKNFHRNVGGNFAITFGLLLTPLMLSMGLAIDYSRMANLENKMRVSSDAALLAAMKKLDAVRTDETTYDETIEILEDEFEPFFEANLLNNGVTNYDSYSIDFIQIDNEAVGTVTVQYDPVLMDIFGHESFDISSELKVNLKLIPENFVFDIVMCIDATGSMQDTIDAARTAAGTFDSDLRTELGISESSNDAKIRIRPIFYRDYTEQDDWEDDYADAVEDAAESGGSGSTSGVEGQAAVEAKREFYLDMYDDSKNYGQKSNGKWSSKTSPENYKRIAFSNSERPSGFDVDDESDVFYDYKSKGSTNHRYYFNKNSTGRATLEEVLELWFPDAEEVEVEDEDGDEVVISADEALDRLVHIAGENDDDDDEWDRVSDSEVTTPEGMKSFVDFLDMNPIASDTTGGTDTDAAILKAQNKAYFEDFLDSEDAQWGADLPEAAGACLDEAMRSNWWVENSDESREFFDISEAAAINDDDALLSERVTTVPLIVFWTDAAIQTLSTTQQYIQPTQPTNYTSFEAQWNDDTIIPYQDTKILMMFGNDSLSGWSTVKNWENYVYGGSLTTGNTEAVDKIADEILKLVPEVLRISG